MVYWNKIVNLKKVPFSHLWIFRRCIGDGIETVLDLGCGTGSFMTDLAKDEGWKIVGVDIYDKYFNIARKRKVYEKLIAGDVVEVSSKLVRRGRKFDVVFCSHVVEHLSKKKAKKLISLMEDLAEKKCIIAMPRGYMKQIKESLDGNPYQFHESAWNKRELEKLGYKVNGVGLYSVWAESGWVRSKSRLIVFLSTLLSFLASPIVYFIPVFAAGLLAVKILEK